MEGRVSGGRFPPTLDLERALLDELRHALTDCLQRGGDDYPETQESDYAVLDWSLDIKEALLRRFGSAGAAVILDCSVGLSSSDSNDLSTQR